MSRIALMIFIAACSLVAGRVPADAAPHDTDWWLAGNSHEQQYYSPLKQIDDKNVGRLGLAWSADMPTQDGLVGNPLVMDGVIYQSGSWNRVYANDVRTGKLLWTFDPHYQFDGATITTWFAARLNRGLALSEDKVIIATGDCRLIALDRKTGTKIWDVVSCNRHEYRGQTAPPHIGAGLVFIGNSCMDSGLERGYVSAFEAATGKLKWRWYTVPGDPAKGSESPLYEKAAKSWGTDWYSKTKGCGQVWDAVTYDPKLNLVFVPVGGVAPFSPSLRAADAGDELFTNSVVALKADTGQYVWHYKVTPHDGWNFEALLPMVADLAVNGRTRHVILEASKGGFFYVLDAATGKFISANKIAPVNWATGIDQKTGRPIFDKEASYWERPEGAIVWGAAVGVRGTQSMAFNPATRLVYIPVHNIPTKMVMDKSNVMGSVIWEADYQDDQHRRSGELVAYDPLTQTSRWRIKHDRAVNGGVITTAGNLIFQGTALGKLEARRADTGQLLWSADVGSAMVAAPSTVEIDGEQLLIVAAGNGGSGGMARLSSEFAACQTCNGPARLLAFKLGGTAKMPRVDPPLPYSMPPHAPYPPELADRGRLIYSAQNCDVCHGMTLHSVGGYVPDLRRISAGRLEMLPKIVHDGLLKATGMPQFDWLSDDDLHALQAFIVNEAWSTYNAQQSGHP